MQVLHGYSIDENSWKAKGGGGQVNIATKGGKKYFIKRLTKPRYPESDKFSGEFKKLKIAECDAWIRERKAIINALPGNGSGTLIKPIEYFRDGPCFYEVANMVDVTNIPYDQIWKETKQDKARIMLTVAMSLADVHKANIVHADLDPGNILISRSAGGNLVTKLIDFTDSFFADRPPETIMSKDFWWSPEVALYSKASDQKPNPYAQYISTKADVFSLGIVFHQYCSKDGKPPICKCAQPWQEFQTGKAPQIDPKIEPEFRDLIASMLEVEPDKRPSMMEVHQQLLGILKGQPAAQKKEEQPQQILNIIKPASRVEKPVQKPMQKPVPTPVPKPAQKPSPGLTSQAKNLKPGDGKNSSGYKVSSVEQLNPRKVRIRFANGKEQIMDIKLAMIQHYVTES